MKKIIVLQNLVITILSLLAIGDIYKGTFGEVAVCYLSTGFAVFVALWALELHILEKGWE